jgi:hypothetical protein
MCLRIASPSTLARSPRAALTVATDLSMSPETQNWCTIASDTMPGEM